MLDSSENKQFIYHYEPEPHQVTDQEHQPKKQFVLHKLKANDDGSMPIDIASLAWSTALGMAGILILCGYQECTNGHQECNWNHFPDVSHVMGKPPLNKLYAIMLTFYACVKQMQVRAYNHRLNGIASKCTQKALITYATISCIFGPAIGYFDVYYNMTIHCTCTALFVVGEVLYIFTVIGVMTSCKDAFKGLEAYISRLVFLRLVVIVLGVITLGSKVVGKDIGIWGAVIEWTLFIESFYVFSIFATMMQYSVSFIPKQH